MSDELRKIRLDPVGPHRGVGRVLRLVGYCVGNTRSQRSSFRAKARSMYAFSYVGFRLALEADDGGRQEKDPA